MTQNVEIRESANVKYAIPRKWGYCVTNDRNYFVRKVCKQSVDLVEIFASNDEFDGLDKNTRVVNSSAFATYILSRLYELVL